VRCLGDHVAEDRDDGAAGLGCQAILVGGLGHGPQRRPDDRIDGFFGERFSHGHGRRLLQAQPYSTIGGASATATAAHATSLGLPFVRCCSSMRQHDGGDQSVGPAATRPKRLRRSHSVADERSPDASINAAPEGEHRDAPYA
jgi:hypothetical protein